MAIDGRSRFYFSKYIEVKMQQVKQQGLLWVVGLPL